MRTLSLFPELLTYGLVAPLILRVILGYVFLDLGILNLRKNEERRWAKVMETIGLRPGDLFARIFGIVQIVGGILLIIGLFAQVAALVFSIICLAELIVEYRAPEILKRNVVFYLLLLAISVSLLFSGAGFFAFDLQL